MTGSSSVVSASDVIGEVFRTVSVGTAEAGMFEDVSDGSVEFFSMLQEQRDIESMMANNIYCSFLSINVSFSVSLTFVFDVSVY